MGACATCVTGSVHVSRPLISVCCYACFLLRVMQVVPVLERDIYKKKVIEHDKRVVDVSTHLCTIFMFSLLWQNELNGLQCRASCYWLNQS